jgi:exodeoxyribonuclease V beta subunit
MTTLIEASAGTGKTHRITQIFAEQIIEVGLPVDQILAVTFTEAATASLRVRVRARLAACQAVLAGVSAVTSADADLAALLSRADPAVARARVDAALAGFDSATVCTIHGFCRRILSRFALEAVSPFVMDPAEHADPVVARVVLDAWHAATHALEPERLAELEARFWSVGADPTDLLAVASALRDDPKLLLEPPPQPELAAGGLGMLRWLAAVAPGRLAEHQRRGGALRFHDLLVRVRDALRGPTGGALRAAARAQWRAVLVDEFQDTDPVQWEIFRELFHGAAPMWLIGDPKQAIYRFRGADFATYLGVAAAPGVHHGHRLDDNHRSDVGLVHAVNYLFGQVPRVFVLDGVDAGPVRAVRPRRVRDARAPLVISYLPRVSPSGAPNLVRFGSAREREAAVATLAGVVAQEVTEWLASPPDLDDDSGGASAPRPGRAGDVAVLTRTNQEARLVGERLRARGVPVVVRVEARVTETLAAAWFLAWLRAVVRPDDARLRARAQLTPLFGSTVRDEVGVGEIAHAEAAAFHRWADRWHRAGFTAMFELWLAEVGVAERLLSRPDGRRHWVDLRHLGEIAQVSGRSSHDLVRWLASGAPGSDVACRLEADADAVTVMTIHKAKGLEWPFVWCPFLSWSPFVGDAERRVLPVVDAHGRRGLDLRPADDPAKRPRIEQAYLEAFSEGVRLVYVALTRARHRVHLLWGPFGNAGGSPLAWLLHGGAASGTSPGPPSTSQTPITPMTARQRTADRFATWSEDELRADLARLAAGSGGTVEIREVSAYDQALRYLSRPPVPLAAASRFPAPAAPGGVLERGWRFTSFSRLTRDHLAERYGRLDGRDVDPSSAPSSAPSSGDLVPLAAVPSYGTGVGDAVHLALQSCDLRDPASVEAALRDAARASGVPSVHLPALGAAVLRMLATPILADDPGLTLAGLEPEDCRSELEFCLPVGGGFDARGRPLLADALADALAASPDPAVPASYPDALRSLAWPALRGFLTGSVDLVLRYRGRVGLIDYKTNDLGPTYADYAPARLAAAAGDHHYVLQALLYAVAVRRWVRWRDPNHAVGFLGVHYLFLRGVDATRDTGVWSWAPSAALLDAAEAALSGG